MVERIVNEKTGQEIAGKYDQRDFGKKMDNLTLNASDVGAAMANMMAGGRNPELQQTLQEGFSKNALDGYKNLEGCLEDIYDNLDKRTQSAVLINYNLANSKIDEIISDIENKNITGKTLKAMQDLTAFVKSFRDLLPDSGSEKEVLTQHSWTAGSVGLLLCANTKGTNEPNVNFRDILTYANNIHTLDDNIIVQVQGAFGPRTGTLGSDDYKGGTRYSTITREDFRRD